MTGINKLSFKSCNTSKGVKSEWIKAQKINWILLKS